MKKNYPTTIKMPKPNDNYGGGKKGNGGPGFEAVAVVIFAFVLIFVVTLMAGGVNTGISANINPAGAANNVMVKAFDVFKKYVNPVIIILDIILFGIIVFSIIKVWPLRTKLSLFYKKSGRSKPKKKKFGNYSKDWAKIIATSEKGTPEALRVAIIEADVLIDTFLKKVGYEGEHIADRLSKIIPGELDSLEDLWKAHRLRNNLVHAPGVVVTRREADKALRQYQAFLKELGAL